MSTYNRADATLGSLAAALGILVVLLLAVVGVMRARQVEHIPSVDYGPDAAVVADQADYTAYAPEGLPEGWVPTSTRLTTGDTVTWVLGFATPEDRHAEFAISDGDPEAFVDETTEGGTADGTAEAGGHTWDRYTSADADRRALVRTDGDAVLVVAGGSDYAELAELAAALRPEDGAGG
jgi:hypothetical protein